MKTNSTDKEMKDLANKMAHSTEKQSKYIKILKYLFVYHDYHWNKWTAFLYNFSIRGDFSPYYYNVITKQREDTILRDMYSRFFEN